MHVDGGLGWFYITINNMVCGHLGRIFTDTTFVGLENINELFIVLLSILRSLCLKDVCFIIIISCEGIW